MSENPQPPTEAAFFTSIREWGLVRANQGLGGVASGLGARVGLAPAPARLLAVLAFLIFPGLFMLAYAAAWGLLPDRQGRIVIQDFGRGVTNVGALLGIAVLTLLGLLGLDSGPAFNLFRYGGFPWDGYPGDFGAVVAFFAILVPLVVIGGGIFLVVYLVKRGDHTSGPTPPPGAPGAQGTTWNSATAPSVPSAPATAPVVPAQAPADHTASTPVGDTSAPNAPASDEPASPEPAPDGPYAPYKPQPWEPALLPGDPRTGLPPHAASTTPQAPPAPPQPGSAAPQPTAAGQGWNTPPVAPYGQAGPSAHGSAYAWNSATGNPAPVPPRSPQPPAPTPPKPSWKVPGPGKGAWLALLGVMLVSGAAVVIAERVSTLAVAWPLAWFAGFAIGLGAILVVVALSGRRLGFLGFLSVLVVLAGVALSANSDDLRDVYYDARIEIGWDSGSEPYVEPTPTYAGPDTISVAEAFGDDYAAVYVEGECYVGMPGDTELEYWFGYDEQAPANAVLRYSTIDKDSTVALRATVTDVTVPANTSLSITNADSQLVVWPERNVSCSVWSGEPDGPMVELTNPDTPVLTLSAYDGGTLIINEEVTP